MECPCYEINDRPWVNTMNNWIYIFKNKLVEVFPLNGTLINLFFPRHLWLQQPNYDFWYLAKSDPKIMPRRKQRYVCDWSILETKLIIKRFVDNRLIENFQFLRQGSYIFWKKIWKNDYHGEYWEIPVKQVAPF